ncbi:Pentatricopeptide repeat-containing protein, chloroplastic [Glycine soja]
MKSAKKTVTCGNEVVDPARLINLAKSQVDYILGKNPLGMSYMVGYRAKAVDRSLMILEHCKKGSIKDAEKNKRLIEALELFHKMQRQRVQPSEFTMVSLLSACTHLGALQHGEWVHDYVKRGHFELNVIVLTTIIGMYCKCGAIVKGIQGQSNTHNICGMVYFAMMLEA